MYSTAKRYGLTINSFVDERLDPVASAEAAAKYLKDSYRIFGDWNLAIASYNCGAGNVNRAIRRSGGKRAFWDIYPYLPRETRGYVPAFVGALYTMKYYKEHGIEPEEVAMPAAVDTFKIHKMLHFKQVSELAGIPLQELKNLNPQYRHEIIPGNEKEYILRIPYNYVNDYINVEDSLYTYKADKFFNPVTIKKIKDGGWRWAEDCLQGTQRRCSREDCDALQGDRKPDQTMEQLEEQYYPHRTTLSDIFRCQTVSRDSICKTVREVLNP